MIKKLTFLAFSIAFCFQLGFTQTSKSTGDIKFQIGNYQDALQEYLKESNGKNYSINTTIQIARCFDALGISNKAYEWYEIAANQDPSNFNYAIEIGKNQMKVGKYLEAKISFLNYSQIDPQLSNHYLATIDNLPNITNNEGSKLNAISIVNSNSNDFAPFIYEGTLYFHTSISNVTLDTDAKKTLKKTEGSIACDINYLALTKGIFTQSNINPISISKNNVIAYSSNLASNTLFESRRMNNTLYIGEFDKHKIVHVKPFPYNKLNASLTDPFLNDNGNILYFSSNMEGGYGGYDLYYSQLENGIWSNPVNLGEEVNSVGNEISPNIDQSNNLYFASDYHAGIGGYDIFKAQWVFGGWMNITNMGLGINSSSDDYYPFVDNETNEIYFTSSRSITKSGEDVYKCNLPIRDIVLSFDGRPLTVKNTETYASQNEIKYEKTVSEIKTQNSSHTGLSRNQQISNNLENSITEESIASINEQLTQIALEEENVPEAIFIGEYQRRHPSDVAAITKKSIAPLSTNVNIEMKMAEIPILTHVPDNDVADIVPPPAFKLPNFGNTNTIDVTNTQAVNYSGARLVSIGQVLKKNISSVYFIQLAAFYSSGGEMSKFEKLAILGNIYKVFAGTAVKVRLGYFNDHTEAAEALSKVKNMGYNDAFLVNADLNTSNMELIYSNHTTNTYPNNSIPPSVNQDSAAEESSENFAYSKPLEVDSKQQYKVRLASYEDPIWFDSSKIKDIGQLEQWSKGSWTIFILSGYNSYEEAEMARIKAVNRGYADAEVVIDNQGIIERLKKN